jgi:hypothetical protein
MIEDGTITKTCPRCNRQLTFTPHIPLQIDKKELNAGHAQVVGSQITCPCGKIL